MHKIRCSLCDKPGDRVTAIVSGPTAQIAICNECLERCSQLVGEHTNPGPTPPPDST